ncbi:hypothetical protein GUJ93_ZPchr0009g1433 [Zizania palustris]|uniref:Uncharacterized protein n=1 Tax=Zizania palustris TaxID=103762 RepID=A0A8J5RMN9_ZIZPA|nr:hypothetical protein GUJ93_ZPchr0009g1433 [Zizania palustris]
MGVASVGEGVAVVDAWRRGWWLSERGCRQSAQAGAGAGRRRRWGGGHRRGEARGLAVISDGLTVLGAGASGRRR